MFKHCRSLFPAALFIFYLDIMEKKWRDYVKPVKADRWKHQTGML